MVDRAALYQCMQDYRAKDFMPAGISGGEPFGTQRPTMAGGLHPFVRRSLDVFRKPVAV